MDILTAYEAYKFFKKHNTQKGVKHWEVLDETVLHVDSNAWPDEMVEKYQNSMEEIMSQLRKEKVRMYKGCGSEEDIMRALTWIVYESSLTNEEKMVPVRHIVKPLNRVFGEILYGIGEYDGRLLTDNEIDSANQSLLEITRKYKQECKDARDKNTSSFFYMIITLIIVYILLS